MGLISGTVFGDVNCNGVFNAGTDGAIGDALVILKDASTNSVIASTTTNTSGFFQFNVANGNYYLEYIKPSAYLSNQFILQGIGTSVVAQNLATYGKSSTFVNGASGNTNMNAPLIVPQTILTGRVFEDTNCNGIFEAGEPVIANVPVEIIIGGQTAIATTNTSGIYQYTVASGGTAVLVFPELVDKKFSPLGADSSANAEGEVVITNVTMNYTTCTPQILTYNQGYCQDTRCIKGCVYLQCGCCNSSSTSGCSGCSSCSNCSSTGGCSGITGGSCGCGVQGYPNMSITLCDANKQPLSGTTTNECGCYEFCNLGTGIYFIKFAVPKTCKIISGSVTTTTYVMNTVTATAQVSAGTTTVNGVSITISCNC